MAPPQRRHGGSRRGIELRQARYFVAVAEDGHFGRAAERTCNAQPPLSRHIRRLERQVGLALLQESPRRVALTPASAALLEVARRMLLQADDAHTQPGR